MCSIETLVGNNYKNWKNDVELALGLADLDLALNEKEPPKPTDASTAEQKAYYQKWERANRLSIMVMKKSKQDSSVLFIDATKECVKVTNSNKLTAENIEAIYNCYMERLEKEHFSWFCRLL